MIRVGVIGYGYWGPNLVRNFHDTAGATVVAVADQNRSRLDVARRRYPSLAVTTEAQELIRRPDVDAVLIATPVASHYLLARAALDAGKHVLVEKPLAASAREAEELTELAAARRLTLMVDHTFVYTPAVRRIRELVRGGELGELYYYDSVRINLGLFQHDVNVLWDLAVHDLSIMDYVLPLEPGGVSATGISHVAGQPHNMAFLTVLYDEPFIAHLHVNWLAPVKVRRTMIGGARRMLTYDDIETSEKIRVYDKGISHNASPENVYKMLIGYRTGDMWAPRLDVTEALALEAAHFVECVEQGTTPETDGEAGLRVVRILEAADRSLAARGAEIKCRPSRS